MMRVAYLLWRFPVVSETFVQREVRALRRLGCDVVVFADSPGKAGGSGCVEREWLDTTTYMWPPSPLRWARALRRFRSLALLRRVRRERYGHGKSLWLDVITWAKALYLAQLMHEERIAHVHAPWATHHAYLAALVGALLGVPHSVQARAFDIHRPSERVGLDVRLRGASFIWTNSDYNRRSLAEAVPEAEVLRVYEGVDLRQFHPQPPADREVPRLLAVGRLVEQKGFAYLLEALALLRGRGVRVQCDIIGGAQPALDPTTEPALRAQRRSLKLAGAVRFLGEQPFARVLEAYRGAYVVVMASVETAAGDRDVTPNVLIEAMAMGLPVVATKVAAIPEIVADRETGLLVPQRDAEALAQAIERLLADRDLRTRLGAHGRARAARLFDVERNLRQVAQRLAVTTNPAGSGNGSNESKNR